MPGFIYLVYVKDGVVIYAQKNVFKANAVSVFIGLALNIFLVWLTGVLNIPLYLDSIGTVLVAALGGVLPGIAVGFLSNCITAIPSGAIKRRFPLTMR